MKCFAIGLLCLVVCSLMGSCAGEQIPISAKIRQITIGDFRDIMPPDASKDSWDSEFPLGDTMCYPDMYIKIYDNNGIVVYNSLPTEIYNNATEWTKGNTVLPNYTYTLNFLEVCVECQYYAHLYDRDEESSTDELMDVVPFTPYIEGCNKKNETLWVNTFEVNDARILVDMVYEY